MTMYKELFSAIAIALTFAAFVPYIQSIRQDRTRPHVFSWILWGITTLVAFLAQLADNGGVGAWPTGVSGAVASYIALLAYQKKADISITRSDWFFFVTAMSSLPLWYITTDPLWAVVILTSVDILAFVPTFRKSWLQPYDEQLTLYVIVIIRNLFSLFALEHLSLTTILFPSAMTVACVLFIIMVLHRRTVSAWSR